ncbi:hypothetical protein NKG94_02670 [Micromonospora sp. M12]
MVGLPLPAGLALATRADFVTRRATAHRLTATSDGLVTVAATARGAGFLVGDYGGTQKVHGGEQLAALLGDLRCTAATCGSGSPGPPIRRSNEALPSRHGSSPRGPAPPSGCHHRAAAPNWSTATPTSVRSTRPAARRVAGVPAEVRRRPAGAARDAGRSPRPALTRPASPRPHASPYPRRAGAPRPTGPGGGAGHGPGHRAPRPALVTEGRRAPGYGPAWLPSGQQVNAEEFEAFVVCPVDPARAVAEGCRAPSSS